MSHVLMRNMTRQNYDKLQHRVYVALSNIFQLKLANIFHQALTAGLSVLKLMTVNVKEASVTLTSRSWSTLLSLVLLVSGELEQRTRAATRVCVQCPGHVSRAVIASVVSVSVWQEDLVTSVISAPVVRWRDHQEDAVTVMTVTVMFSSVILTTMTPVVTRDPVPLTRVKEEAAVRSMMAPSPVTALDSDMANIVSRSWSLVTRLQASMVSPR